MSGGVSNVDIDGNNALQIKGYRSRHLHVCYTTPPGSDTGIERDGSSVAAHESMELIKSCHHID
jgi:hypothetical protein